MIDSTMIDSTYSKGRVKCGFSGQL
jgi:hypothetical protein